LGVKAANTLANNIKIRLLTLKITLKLKSMLRSIKSAGKERAKQLKQLSTIGKEAKEHLELVRRKARQIDKLEGRTLLKD
jgi:hypothetical protein